MKSKNLLRVSALALLGMAPLSAFACGSEPYIGEVCTFAANYCPNGYLPADGRQVAINSNQALYSLLGTSFGGNGTSYFNLPDLRGRSAVGTGTSDYGSNTTIGQKSGTASVALTANNLPQHTHPASITLGAGSVMNAPLSLAVSGGTVSGQTISGSVTVNALNGSSTPGSGSAQPSSTANTIGKIGVGSAAFYPQGSSPVAVPSSQNLTVSGGTISGATASGNVSIPATNTTLPVAVGPNSTQGAPVSTVSPNLGLTYCIASVGIYPTRP